MVPAFSLLGLKMVQLVPAAAGADSLPTSEDVDEGALRLQICKFGCTEGGIRGFGFSNRPGPSNRILDVSDPDAEVSLRSYVCGRIARCVVNGRRNDLDDAVVGDDAGERVGRQVSAD